VTRRRGGVAVLTAVLGAAILLAGAATLLAGGCGGEPHRPSGTVTDGGVRVAAVLTRTPSVEVTFTPDRPGFHLYSLDLPAEGVDGLGTPTVVRVRAGATVTGPARADRPVHRLRIDALNVELPVYPDGPVTVALPVRPTTSRRVELVVTYGACSAGACLPPVRDRLVVLT
jgi:hypothetical protein